MSDCYINESQTVKRFCKRIGHTSLNEKTAYCTSSQTFFTKTQDKWYIKHDKIHKTHEDMIIKVCVAEMFFVSPFPDFVNTLTT